MFLFKKKKKIFKAQKKNLVICLFEKKKKFSKSKKKNLLRKFHIAFSFLKFVADNGFHFFLVFFFFFVWGWLFMAPSLLKKNCEKILITKSFQKKKKNVVSKKLFCVSSQDFILCLDGEKTASINDAKKKIFENLFLAFR